MLAKPTVPLAPVIVNDIIVFAIDWSVVSVGFDICEFVMLLSLLIVRSTVVPSVLVTVTVDVDVGIGVGDAVGAEVGAVVGVGVGVAAAAVIVMALLVPA